ncbi:MAG: hypothetical protein JRG91_14175, partial [Deltaproteobacteria bacterium]|nr:hypothetical protein [Deltaproteobacteria bacterium]
MRETKAFFILALCGALAACGGNTKNTSDDTATDDDVVTDSTGDVATDVDTDTVPDATPDGVDDPVEDAPVDSPVDTPTDGTIGCPPPELDCDGVCTDVSDDEMNCGECGNECGTDETCVAGVCGGD